MIFVSQGMYDQQPTVLVDGQRAKTLAKVFSIIGFFIAPIALGAIAIWQARKAESVGVKANGWLWLGVIDIASGAIGVGMCLATLR